MKRAREFTLAATGSALWWVAEHLLEKSVGNVMEACVHFVGRV